MKRYTLHSLIILFTAFSTWAILSVQAIKNEPVNTLAKPAHANNALAKIRAKHSSELGALRQKVKLLETQLAQANQTIESWGAQRQNSEKVAEGRPFYPEQEAKPAVYNEQPFTPDDPRRHQSRVEIVNPTPEQNQTYEAYKTQLDDPLFLQSLNLQAFASLHEVSTLPEPMKLALIGKAIEQYNQGNISEEVFLGAQKP